MNKRSATPSIGFFATLSGLTVGSDAAPDWVQLFPAGPAIETRDGRAYRLDDAAALVATFDKDAIDLPVDVNHSTEIRAPKGEEAEPVGWIKQLEVRSGLLFARVDWLDKGKALLAAKAYRYVSPAFWHDKAGQVTRLKSLALVASPALPSMPALAAATDIETPENSMKTIAVALGLAEGADEAACLAAVTTLKSGTVDKAVHDQTIATLQTTQAQLATLQGDNRKAKVDALIEGALTAKKVLPAQKDHYVGLCATDDGLAQVERLLAVTPAQLSASGLDDRRHGDADVDLTDPVALAAAGTVHQKKMAEAGQTISFAEAVLAVKEKQS